MNLSLDSLQSFASSIELAVVSILVPCKMDATGIISLTGASSVIFKKQLLERGSDLDWGQWIEDIEDSGLRGVPGCMDCTGWHTQGVCVVLLAKIVSILVFSNNGMYVCLHAHSAELKFFFSRGWTTICWECFSSELPTLSFAETASKTFPNPLWNVSRLGSNGTFEFVSWGQP